MANEFVTRCGLVSRDNSQISGSLQATGSLGVTGSVIVSGSLLNQGNVNFGENAYILGAWSVGSPLITVRYFLGGAGSQTSALAFGGLTMFTTWTCTEEYDGTSWTAGGALITAIRKHAGAGTQNAALSIGGYDTSYAPVTCTEEYDGTTWAVGGALITARLGLGGAGTQNAGLAFAGTDFGLSFGFYSTCTEEYNGSSWAVGGALINATVNNGGAGTQNAALSIGGSYTLKCTEEYDGTIWSAGGALAFNSYNTATAGTSQTNAFTAGSPSQITQEYDGTSWFASSGANISKAATAGAGNKAAGLAFGGLVGVYGSTEEYTGGVSLGTKCTFNYDSTSGSINTTGSLNVGFIYSSTVGQEGGIENGISAWKTASPLITGRIGLAGAGTQNASLAFGGVAGSKLSCTEEYNSFSWSAGGALITARCALAGAGTQNSALAFGGTPVYSAVACTEEYNGTSWSAGGALITARIGLAGAGTQNEALAFGGNPSSFPFVTAATEEYDGTSWTAGGALITARRNLAGAGTQNCALAFGGFLVAGFPNFTAFASNTEEYNGTSWTQGGSLNVPRCRLAGGGDAEYTAYAFGGTFNSSVSCTEKYDGSIWAVEASMNIARDNLAGVTDNGDALAIGGAGGGFSLTERFDFQIFYNAPFSSLTYTTSDGNVSVRSTNNLNLYSCLNTSLSSIASTIISSKCCMNLSAYSLGISAPLKTCIQTPTLGITAAAVILSAVSASLNFVDDIAAATGGVPLGGLYRSGSLIRIRLI